MTALNTTESGRVSCSAHWGGCDTDPRPLLPVPMPKDADIAPEKGDRVTAAFRDACDHKYRCHSHSENPAIYRLMRREGGSTNVPYTVDLDTLTCNCADAARLRTENARELRDGTGPGSRYCRHIVICDTWRLMPDLLTVALLPELPTNPVPCHAETPAEEKRYTVRVHQDGGSYVSLSGGTWAEAEGRADSINHGHADSNIVVFAAIEEEGE